MNKKQLQANLFLFTTAFIWGFSFVAQRTSMDHIGPFMFSGLRFLLGAISLIPVIYVMDRMEKQNRQRPEGGEASAASALLTDEERKARDKYTRKGGVVCGSVLFVAAGLQQVGLVYTSAGKTAFITALYIVLVPIFGIFLKQKIGLNAWLSAAIAAVGLYLLCIKSGFYIEFGDLIVLIGSVFWAAHILVIDHFVSGVHAVKMSAFQFIVAGVLSLIVSAAVETSTTSGILEAAFPIVFVGVFSCGIAFTLQILGQKNAAPTTASLILSMEAVFGALGGFLILGEILTVKELIGCVLMFTAVVLSQLPSPAKCEKSSL